MDNYTIEDYKNEDLFVRNPDRLIVGFSIFYGDKSNFKIDNSPNGLLELWKNAPIDNVQVLVIFENNVKGDNYRVIINGWDYYIFDGDNFYGCNDTRKYEEYTGNKLKRGMIKYGLYIDEDLYRKIYKLAVGDEV